MASKAGSKKSSVSDEQQKQLDIQEHEDEIFYSARYDDDQYEYRHVILPKQIARWLPAKRLLTEQEWRGLGVKQSLGWQHHMLHDPEPHILIFRREKATTTA